MPTYAKKRLSLSFSDVGSTSPIFIGGAGRSGTSLLRTILNRHPHIAIGPELKVTPVVAEAWAKLVSYQGHLQEHFHVNPGTIHEAFGALLRTLLESYRLSTGKPRIGEKTPDNVFCFMHLHHMFPEAPLLHIYRDGRDVVRSLLTMEWVTSDGRPHPTTQNARQAAQYWVRAVRAGKQAARQPGVGDRLLEIRYEDLVSEPETVGRRIFAHIGEPWMPHVLDVDKQVEQYYQSVQRPITPRAVGKWRQSLTPEQKRAIKDVAGDMLIELGYATDNDW